MPINGQAIKQDFLVIRDDPKTQNESFAAPENQDCCFILPALAEKVYTSPLKNDRHSWIQWYNQAFTEAKMTLQKVEGGEYIDVADLEDSTYGTNFEYGFYETIYDEKAIGYLIDWRKVLLEEGEGDYRIKSTGKQVIGDDVVTYSFEFCLKEFTPNRADKTVRLTWYKNGNTGSLTNDARKVDYGTLNWLNEIRLPNAYFGDDKSETEDEYTKYQPGNMVWLQQTQVEDYTLGIGLIPNMLHRFLKIDAFHSDEIYVTDYNLNNDTTHINRKVIWQSSYEPRRHRGSQLSSVTVTFKQADQNLNVKRS